MPNDAPAAWASAHTGADPELAGFRKTAIRVASGRTSLRSCSSLPLTSFETLLTPVTLPPGRERLATNPLPTGSPTETTTIGIVRVARFTANAAGVVHATRTS